MIGSSIPIIDWGNPLTDGLVFDAPLWEGGGKMASDLVTDTQATFSNAPTWTSKPLGSAVDFSGASSTKALTYTTKSLVNSLEKATVEVWFNWPSSRSDGQSLFLKGTDATRRLHVGEVNAGLGLVVLVTAWSGGNAVWAISAPSVGDHHLVVTYDGSSASNKPVAYLDSVVQGFTFDQVSSGTRSADNTALYIGNRETTTNGWNSYIYGVRVWNRIVDGADVRTLYSNPSVIYQKPDIPYSYQLGTPQATKAIWFGINF